MAAITHSNGRLVQEFIDAPHEASGPAPDDVAPHFEPPFFEWWDTRASTDPSSTAKVYGGWEESIAKLRRVMTEQGPFDGAMGFSQVLLPYSGAHSNSIQRRPRTQRVHIRHISR